MFIWTYTGEVTSKRIRERYLQAILRQDISYFESIGPGEIATRIQNDTRKCPPLTFTYHLFLSCLRHHSAGHIRKSGLAR